MEPESARDVLNRIRRRGRAAPAALTHCGGRPANDLIDEVFTLNTPGSIQGELDQLRASYDIVNLQARGIPEWDVHYAEFLRYADELRPRTEGVTAWLRTSAADVKAIRLRAQRLEEWKQALAKRGVDVREPDKKPEPDAGGALRAALDAAPWVVGGFLVLQALRR